LSSEAVKKSLLRPKTVFVETPIAPGQAWEGGKDEVSA
jgi:hypothetical protein